MKSTSLDVWKSHGNNTDLNKTENNKTNLIYPEPVSPKITVSIDGMDERRKYESYFRDHLSISDLKISYPYDHGRIEEIVGLMVDTVCSTAKTTKEELKMPKKDTNISIGSGDDRPSTDKSRADPAVEKVQEIPLSELHPFKNHPFKVLDDEAMQKTVESIQMYGVMVPAIARPSPDGGYELIAGHRRLRVSKLAGKETMPVIVREMDDDDATICSVKSCFPVRGYSRIG